MNTVQTGLAAALAVGVAAGLALAAAGGPDAPWLAALSLVLMATLLIKVPVPWGGWVPLGFALATALLALPARPFAVLPTAVAMAVGMTAVRAGRDQATVAVLRLAPPVLAALAVSGAHGAVRPDAGVLERVVVVGSALFAVDAAVLVHIRRPRQATGRPQLRHIALVDLTLLCGAALIAVATSGFGVVMAAVAAFPLLITRFSFQRYAQARETLSQTVQALGLVPELAGLVAIGHSERTATYAWAIADELGFGAALRDRIVTASRLKHLGAVPFDPVDPDQPTTLPEPAEVAASGALILREAGFPTEVAELIELSRVGALGHPSPSLEAAVVRVATAFDQVVGEDETAVPRGLAVVSSMAHDANTRRAAAALLEVTAGSTAIVSDAIAVGARFRTAASDLELEDLLTQGMGADVVPFVRRHSRVR